MRRRRAASFPEARLRSPAAWCVVVRCCQMCRRGRSTASWCLSCSWRRSSSCRFAAPSPFPMCSSSFDLRLAHYCPRPMSRAGSAPRARRQWVPGWCSDSCSSARSCASRRDRSHLTLHCWGCPIPSPLASPAFAQRPTTAQQPARRRLRLYTRHCEWSQVPPGVSPRVCVSCMAAWLAPNEDANDF
jgi:hypothetical protein